MFGHERPAKRTRQNLLVGEARRALQASLAVALLSLGVAACDACHGGASVPPAPPPVVEPPPSLRVYFMSDLAGALEPCGCVKDQLGGLDHAAAWIDAQRGRAPASMLVTAGPTFFMNPILEKDHRSQDIAKAEALAGALRHLGMAAWAPAANDWSAGPPELAKLAQSSGAPVLLANVAADAGTTLASMRVVPVNSFKVGLIGVGAPSEEGAPAGPTLPEAVRAASARARAEGANIVIVLASVGRGEAKRIADAVPDLSAIIVGEPLARGDGNTPTPPGELIGNVLIAETGNHLQTLGAIDFFVRGDSFVFADGGGLGDSQRRQDLTRRIDDLHFKIANWERDRSIAQADLAARRADLTRIEDELAHLGAKPPPAQGSYFRYTMQEVRSSLGQDPSVTAALSTYYRFVNDANRVQLQGRFPPEPLEGQPRYIGVDACTTCHASERKFWDKTPHAAAYATLSSQSKEYNLDCVSCHVTGYGATGGSTVTHVDKLKDVQCEVCHGPGSFHAAKPQEARLPIPAGDACVTCHHSPHVEGFDPVSKMAMVIGPGHGR